MSKAYAMACGIRTTPTVIPAMTSAFKYAVEYADKDFTIGSMFANFLITKEIYGSTIQLKKSITKQHKINTAAF